MRPRSASSSCRVQRALVELRAGLDLLAVLDEQARAARERVAVLLAGVVGDDDGQRLVGLLDRRRCRPARRSSPGPSACAPRTAPRHAAGRA